MSTINERVPKALPVECNFFFNTGAPLVFTIEGHTYPYKHQADEVSRESDSRYAAFINYINTPIVFDAIDSETLGHPKVVTPPGVQIVEYLWDLGDGTVGQGPLVTHTYTIAGVETSVVLHVIDTRGFTYSCRKPLNLVYALEGSQGSNKLIS